MQYQVCAGCRKITKLDHVWAVTFYEDFAKDVVYQLKFERAGYLAEDIARMMKDLLPILPGDTIITYAPTALKRVRIRGYDQSELIAKELAKLTGLEFQKTFKRVTNTRQLGVDRKTRFSQAEKAYELTKPTANNQQFLIVDDVTTSGATLEILSKILKKSGAKSVSAIVFAQAVD